MFHTPVPDGGALREVTAATSDRRRPDRIAANRGYGPSESTGRSSAAPPDRRPAARYGDRLRIDIRGRPLAQNSPATSASPAQRSPIRTADRPSKADPQPQTRDGAPKPEPERGTVWCDEEEPVDDRGNYVCVKWFVVDGVADVDRLDRGAIATITINWSQCVGVQGGQVHSWCPG